jgi:hypothetical protein
MSRDVRIPLAIMLGALILSAPIIFADLPPAQGTTSYLALIFQSKPSATPTTAPTSAPTPMPTRTPVPPTATPTLPPPSFNNCQADPNPSAAPHYPVRIVTINKVAETVTLQNVSTNAIDLTGWTMCSITGNQQHPIFGTLAPGQSVVFPGPAGNIWNNSVEDDGALYNPDGQLVSYVNS